MVICIYRIDCIQESYTFRSMRPSLGTHLREQAKGVTNILGFVICRKFGSCNIGVLDILCCVSFYY